MPFSSLNTSRTVLDSTESEGVDPVAKMFSIDVTYKYCFVITALLITKVSRVGACTACVLHRGADFLSRTHFLTVEEELHN